MNYFDWKHSVAGDDQDHLENVIEKMWLDLELLSIYAFYQCK